MNQPTFHLGLDFGSISLKAVLLDSQEGIVFSRWMRVSGAPMHALAEVLSDIHTSHPAISIVSIGVTGSGRELIREMLSAHGINEITAQATACAALVPRARTIIEIGGQDSKLIVLGDSEDEALVREFQMNELCAAGTGAFLDQQAARLRIPIEAFAQLAERATDPVAIAGRCAVFAKTDMTHHQQEGRPLPDIIAGLNEALVRSYLANMVRGKDLPRSISFQGGVASNAGLALAFRKILKLDEDDLIVPDHHRVMGAVGAALIAARRDRVKPRSPSDLAATLQKKLPFQEASCVASASPPGHRHSDEERGMHFLAASFGATFQASDGVAPKARGGSAALETIRRTPENASPSLRVHARHIASENDVVFASPLAPSRPPRPLRPPSAAARRPECAAHGAAGTFLGIDVGSVSVKIAAIDGSGIVFSDYRFSPGKPLETLRAILDDIAERLRDDPPAGVGITGSGRLFIGRLVGADVILNEITAQARAASFLHPGADTVIEIGGQDAKFFRLHHGQAVHFSMNRVCAAGTGAFLQEQAARLRVDLEGAFADEAFASASPVELGNRCTVFMESDLVAHQQQGCARRDLIAGLARSIVANYMEKVVAGQPMGQEILFIGGVAENRAVTAALEEYTGRPIITSTAGRISGAVGAALAAQKSREEGHFVTSRFSGTAAHIGFDHITCDACPNRCRIARTQEEEPRTFGGRCERWEGRNERRSPHRPSLLKQRQALLDRGSGSPQKIPQRASIGIPRALFAFDRLPVWRTFFEAMGCHIVISPPTTPALLAEGIKHLVVETCLPVKAFCAHVHWFSSHADVDALFIPSFVVTGMDRHGRETAHCPYIQGLEALARPMTDLPLLAPAINWRMHPDDEGREMRSLAKQLGIVSQTADEAWKTASATGTRFRQELRSLGTALLAQLSGGTLERAFVLLGKDYNVGDPALNSRAAEILEARGEACITQDMLSDDSGTYPAAYRAMYWSHGKEILAAAERIAATPGLYAVVITSFGCGPDSFTLRAIRDIMQDKPLLLLEVDEHSSSVGMETRIEAFLDALPKAPAKPIRRSHKPAGVMGNIRTVYLPHFSDHGYAFAAAIRALGLEPRLTPLPDDASARLGASHATTGECHPYTLMLGDYLKVAGGTEDLSAACYFMPESASCRVALFGTQMRLVGEEIGAALPIVTRIEELTPALARTPRRSLVRALTTYWEMMRGIDFALQHFYETRAFETTPGATDTARAAAQDILWERILEGRPRQGLRDYRDIIGGVETDRRQKRIRIGITGDYYTRICDYANAEIFREIERQGGVIMLPPTMSEFVKYDAHQRPRAMLRHRRFGDAAQSLVMRAAVNRREREVRSIFDSALDYDVPLDYERAMTLIRPYMSAKLPAGLTGSIAAILEQLRAGADGILNLITFHCTYGLVVSSTLASIDRQCPDIPKLTLIFEGLKPTHNRTRLEAFMERAWERARRRGNQVQLSQAFDFTSDESRVTGHEKERP